MKRRPPNVSGLLPIIKPAGPTSHDVVAVARRALNQQQVGHTGTLDPAADGLLVLCLGGYTKLVEYLTECDKTYTGHIGLGLQTTTDDREGAAVRLGRMEGITPEAISEAASKMVGPQAQIPPLYAAIKIGGKKLYEYAREGATIEIEPRNVTVYSFEVGAPEPAQAGAEILGRAPDGPGAQALPEAAALVAEGGPGSHPILRVPFRSRVSSGTYLRALARDLGTALGCGGYLMDLRREAIGQVDTTEAITLEALRENPESVKDFLITGSDALDSARYPVFTILKAFEERMMRGQPINEKMLEGAGNVARLQNGAIVGICSEQGALLSVMQIETFEEQRPQNPYGSRFSGHFRARRIFPGGLN